MKNVILILTVTFLFGHSSEAHASKVFNVIHDVSCQEAGAQMFDAIAANVDYFYDPLDNIGQLKATLYHRVEHDTVFLTQIDVREQQASRPGAPKQFIGKGFDLKIQTTGAPSKKGYPAILDMRADGLRMKIQMVCQFAR